MFACIYFDRLPCCYVFSGEQKVKSFYQQQKAMEGPTLNFYLQYEVEDICFNSSTVCHWQEVEKTNPFLVLIALYVYIIVHSKNTWGEPELIR